MKKKSVTVTLKTMGGFPAERILQGGVDDVTLDENNNLLLAGDNVQVIVNCTEWSSVVAIPDESAQAAKA